MTDDRLPAIMKADWWPLEVAVVWIATGDKAVCLAAADLALSRRSASSCKLPTLGQWLMIREGLSRQFEAVEGSLYRTELREGWTPGKIVGNGPHPIDQALKLATEIMADKHSTGCCGDSPRGAIPPKLWKRAVIV